MASGAEQINLIRIYWRLIVFAGALLAAFSGPPKSRKKSQTTV
jgi:hypothetical protein